MPFLVVTRNQAKSLRRALRQAEGLPARGVTIGQCTWTFVPPETCELDEDGEPKDTPGWTTDCVGEGDEAGGQVAIEVPTRLEARLSAQQRAALVAEDALPTEIKAVRAAKLAGALSKADAVKGSAKLER